MIFELNHLDFYFYEYPLLLKSILKHDAFSYYIYNNSNHPYGIEVQEQLI